MSAPTFVEVARSVACPICKAGVGEDCPQKPGRAPEHVTVHCVRADLAGLFGRDAQRAVKRRFPTLKRSRRP